MRKALVPGLPFALSLLLSLSTIGSHIYWQDSGLFLTAVHDMGVLYPHGFVVYQLLCKLWTSLLFFVDFVLAVHLFSAVCAASASAVLALAARDFLKGPSREVPSVLAGMIAAAGYTFWFAGLYAKVYALYYLVLALLLWTVVRTAGAPSKRGAALVAALAGLAWTVHPAVALGGLGLAAYFVHASKTIGVRSAAVCLLPGPAMMLLPALAIPLLSARDVEHSMGLPRTAGEVLHYLLGSRFVGSQGVFGLESSRVTAFLRFVWEEYPGVGLLLLGFGVWTLIRTRRELVIPGLLWVVPYVLVTLLFKIEGQSDHWYVAAGLPLVLAIAVGVEALGSVGRNPRALQLAAGILAVGWSTVANIRDLQLRNEVLPEQFGRLFLARLDPNAILFAQLDDVVATTWALQSVRRERPDVTVVSSLQLGAEELWYDRLLQRRHPELRLPRQLPVGRALEADVLVSAYLRENAGGPRPLYLTTPTSPELLPAGYGLVPQGVVWKLVRTDADRVDTSFWQFPVEPEALPARFGRPRGLAVTPAPGGGYDCEYEPYEKRMQWVLIKARIGLADWGFRHGQYETAARLYESVLPLDVRVRRIETVLQFLALSDVALGRPERAESAFRETLAVATRPWVKASALLGLGDLARGRGDAVRALESYNAAAQVEGLTPEQQAIIRQRLSGR